MAYTFDFSISLGTSRTGLTLNAQIVDSVGADTGAAITTGFTEIGTGCYLLHCTTIPDDHRGGIKIYEAGGPGVILGFDSINPEVNEPGSSCNYPPSAPALPLGVEEDVISLAVSTDAVSAAVDEEALDIGIDADTVQINITEDDLDIEAGC